MTGATAPVHVLKVTLRDVRPAVWRRLEVPSATTLGELHEVLQDAFGWDDDHLHDFRVRGTRYAAPTPEAWGPFWLGEQARNEDAAVLGRVAPRAGDVVDYTYDFGDEWRHRIEVEAVVAAEPDSFYPRCSAGAGLAPEEDTGAVRRGRFDQSAVQRLNDRWRGAGAVRGRDLPVKDAAVDTVLAGIFPELVVEESEVCECGCEATVQVAAGLGLPALRPSSEAELASLAVDSELVHRAVGLALWVGEARALTPSRVLRPADALGAVHDLGLAEPLLARTGQDTDGALPPRPGRDPDGATDTDTSGQGTAQANRSIPEKIRSAKDLPYLHPLWAGCLAAGLVEIRGGKAYAGAGLRVWLEAGQDSARVESWASLLGGYLRLLRRPHAPIAGCSPGPAHRCSTQASP